MNYANKLAANLCILILIAGIGLSPISVLANATDPAVDFSVSTGAAVHSIPIDLPAGRNGMAPNLSLNYNSYQGNGWVGVGWSLDMGSIQRLDTFGVDYSADNYVALENNVSEKLAPRVEWGQDYYGAKIESDFSKYYFNAVTGGFEKTTTDGLKYFYGTSPSSRQDDPSDNTRIYKWCLDRVEDTFGNYLTVSYTKDNGQIYLDEINFTGYDCEFRSKVATHSTAKLPPIPRQSCHLFHGKVAT